MTSWLRQTPRGDDLGLYRAIMWRIAQRAVADYYRLGWAMAAAGLDEWFVAGDPYVRVDDLDEIVQIVSVVEKRRQRSALMMHALGFTTPEIAAHLHATEANVYQLICRARARWVATGGRG